MWHCFSVVLAIITASGVGGLGYLARSPQAAFGQPFPGIESTGESAEIQADAVAGYVQRNQRSGSGRRGMRG